MVQQSTSTANAAPLMRIVDAIVVHQALYAAAKLGLADLLDGNPQTTIELADQLAVNEPALYRIMRLLASQGIFEESLPRTFTNTDLSYFLRSGVPGSVRPLFLFTGSELYFAPFGEILHSVQTGKPARDKLYGMNVFEYLKEHPEMARVFDDAMTNRSRSIAPAVAMAYDFGAWASVMDLGGGNGMLLSAILMVHTELRGVLADLPHVVERASELGFLGGELQTRCELRGCDMFREIPSGCRAYVMKSVIHDWDDERAQQILVNCRRAVPDDGALLMVELAVADGNSSALGKVADVAMMVLTGGKERTIEEYRALLAGAGFRLSRVFPVDGDFNIIESLPI
jgi:hypothetical protein